MQAEAEQIWNKARKTLSSMLNGEVFNLWFAPIRALEATENEIVLGVANDFCELWLKDNYGGLIREVVSHVTRRPMQVEFVIKTDGTSPPLSLARNRNGSSGGGRAAPRGRAAGDGFNPNNTFETFVVGSNNAMAHGCAMCVAHTPGRSYNPLFLYGGVGLGKTHLLHAIGHYVLRHRTNASVTYLSCEKFTNEFIEGIRKNQVARFRKRYRQTDVLLIDDIQFLSGKERIQEEFFHTFNTLHEAHKQMVLTCDRPACEIVHLEQRLVSRFEWGSAADMKPPDVETRVAILRKKAKFLGVHLPDEIIDFLANRIRANIRRLEGALIRVASYASITSQSLTIELVENLLRDILQEEGRLAVTINTIQRKVAAHYDIRFADMLGRCRPESIAFPRQIAMYLSRELTQKSLNSIGEAFGGRDHGTVLHACRLVKDRMEVEPVIRQAVRYLETQLQR